MNGRNYHYDPIGIGSLLLPCERQGLQVRGHSEPPSAETVAYRLLEAAGFVGHQSDYGSPGALRLERVWARDSADFFGVASGNCTGYSIRGDRLVDRRDGGWQDIVAIAEWLAAQPRPDRYPLWQTTDSPAC
ncbi:hypothetical protein [Amycolatopsis suaedae]|uniref:Uncharacterized protein n=1 Tax=Amycolatopsis suaedae TaxID=2510978 RepID=A0A4Q7IZI7_9PSEU|nr:hypothetical protein [Amycolatopsis suaedae]RZQ59848.1 hypothetical protein EWH70_32565 [Amycolatopsis suaedae]